MSDLILIYITCKDTSQAMKIGRQLLQKRVAACTNIIPSMHSQYFWPPKKDAIEETEEAVLIVKTIAAKWQAVEKEVHKIHSYKIPCIMSISTTHVTKKYYDWLVGELT